MAASQEPLRKEIEGLKKFQPIQYYFLFAFLLLAGSIVVEGLFTMLIDKTPFIVYLKSYTWKKMVWTGAWWLGIVMLTRWYKQKAIRKKEAESQKIQASI